MVISIMIMRNMLIELILIAALLFGGCNHQDEQFPTHQIRPGYEICPMEVCTDVVNHVSYSIAPIESRFMIEGYYGCIAAFPYRLVICQKGPDVIYIFNDGEEHVLDYEQFEKFWYFCSLIDLNLLKPSYGSMRTTADFRGHLSIECRTESGRFVRKVMLQVGMIEDAEFIKLINAMMKMVSKSHRLPGWLSR